MTARVETKQTKKQNLAGKQFEVKRFICGEALFFLFVFLNINVTVYINMALYIYVYIYIHI